MKRNGIMFGNKHSYDDFGLVLTEVNIGPAVPVAKYINIPGRNGALDITEENGEVIYSDRDCSFSFVVDNAKLVGTFEQKKTEINNYLNGKYMSIVLDEDNGFYYHGRFKVENYSQNGYVRRIVISAKVGPYKLKITPTTVTAVISGSQELICENIRMSVVPTITCDTEFTFKFGDLSVTANAGTHIFPDIKFVEGSNIFTCAGTGTVTITYQEGAL